MDVAVAALGTVGRCYEQLLAFSSNAAGRLGGEEIDRLRDQYATVGFVKVERVLPARVFVEFARSLIPIVAPIAADVVIKHEVRGQNSLSDGAQFRRVDPECMGSTMAGKALQRVFDALGITQFGSRLGASVLPLVSRIVGPVSYRRLYFYLYEEGHYISAHNDHHVGPRVDVQFPVSLATVAGVRVLADGLFRIHYDSPGSMNVLGPCVWHDVPPIVRSASGRAPLRFNMGLRFMPD